MRTTLTLDDDVAALLERLAKKGERSFKEIVNDALREGLRRLQTKPDAGAPYQTRAVCLGKCRLSTLDDLAEALVAAEGEAIR